MTECCAQDANTDTGHNVSDLTFIWKTYPLSVINWREPGHRARSRMLAKEKRCNWPNLPMRFRSNHPGHCHQCKSNRMESHGWRHAVKTKSQIHVFYFTNIHKATQTSHIIISVFWQKDLNTNAWTDLNANAWKNIPMIAIIASRPLANSALSLVFFTSGSSDVMSFHPKSPAKAAVPGDWSWETSQKAMYAAIWAQPPAGTLEIAASPLGTSANFKPADGDKKPGNFPVISGVMYPMVASMEMRPCLISVARRRLKFSTLPSLERPAGSQNPTGAWTPSSFSNARKGEAV